MIATNRNMRPVPLVAGMSARHIDGLVIQPLTKLTPLILIRPEYAQPQRRKDFRNTSYLRCYRLVHPWNPW